jgi:hypothetical protein
MKVAETLFYRAYLEAQLPSVLEELAREDIQFACDPAPCVGRVGAATHIWEVKVSEHDKGKLPQAVREDHVTQDAWLSEVGRLATKPLTPDLEDLLLLHYFLADKSAEDSAKAIDQFS